MDCEETSYNRSSVVAQSEEEHNMDNMRKGPWTDEEDSLLINYVTLHGEGHWNSLSRCAGLRRTGKSCRLRWLNYLRPDVRRGNITLQEQLLILQLHSRWGNRWSKIAEHLPGRTDNEIKNYWRTRVQKQAKQMKCDVDSKQFKDTMHHIWIPRLAERIRSQSRSSAGNPTTTTTTTHLVTNQMDMDFAQTFINMGSDYEIGFGQAGPALNPEMSGCSSSSLETQVSPVSDLTDVNFFPGGNNYYGTFQHGSGYCPEFVAGPCGFQQDNAAGLGCNEDSFENMWNDEDIRFLLQQFNYGF